MSIPVRSIQGLLRSSAVRGINFQLAGVKVSGAAFAALASRFSEITIRQRIRVTTNPAIVGNSALALYDHIDDKINVRSAGILLTADGKGQFVHECVHALHDWQGNPLVSFVTEAMAFVAEAWYHVNAGSRVAELNFAPSVEMFAVAQSIRQRHGEHRYQNSQSTTLPEMTQEEFQRIRRELRNVYRYRGRVHSFDGIGGHQRSF